METPFTSKWVENHPLAEQLQILFFGSEGKSGFSKPFQAQVRGKLIERMTSSLLYLLLPTFPLNKAPWRHSSPQW